MSHVKHYEQAVEEARKREQEKLQEIRDARETIMNDAIYKDAESEPKIAEGLEEDISSSEDSSSEDEDEVVEWEDAKGRNDQLWSDLRF